MLTRYAYSSIQLNVRKLGSWEEIEGKVKAQIGDPEGQYLWHFKGFQRAKTGRSKMVQDETVFDDRTMSRLKERIAMKEAGTPSSIVVYQVQMDG